MKKQRTKRISLAFMGPGFEEAYLDSRLMHYSDQEKMDAVQSNESLNPHQRNIDTLKLFFVSGKTPDETGELTELTAQDLDDWDIFSVSEVVRQVGMPDPKASEPSTTTLPVEDPSPLDSSDLSIASDLDSAPVS
jgi:hypothetical protein